VLLYCNCWTSRAIKNTYPVNDNVFALKTGLSYLTFARCTSRDKKCKKISSSTILFFQDNQFMNFNHSMNFEKMFLKVRKMVALTTRLMQGHFYPEISVQCEHMRTKFDSKSPSKCTALQAQKTIRVQQIPLDRCWIHPQTLPAAKNKTPTDSCLLKRKGRFAR